MIVLALLLSLLAPGVTGVVRDPSGAVVAGAAVFLRGADGEQHVVTGPDGRFEFHAPPGGALTLIVRAAGFAEAHLAVDLSDTDIEVRLTPASLAQAVTVTATRSVSAEAPAAATNVLTAEALQSSPAATLDDQLQAIPGFSLFRRTSSRAANPTTQGVTMRGLSASGASRSLVLADGVPMNDPFGGWVYWDRLPQAAIDRVEVVRGGTSDLYGADAVGGVIQVLSRVPTRGELFAETEYAERDTPRVSLYTGGMHRGWNGFVSGEWERSDGYYIIAPEQRGPVDTPAGANYRTAYGSGGYQAGTWRAALRANLFHEDRQNGTPLTTNTTSSRSVSGELAGGAFGGFWSVRGYGGTQDYHQGFSAVNLDRTAETQTQLQYVPSSNGGASAQVSGWKRGVAWTVGGDLRRITGESDEQAFVRGAPGAYTTRGGVEWSGGGFARADVALRNDVTVSASAGVDRWSEDPNAAAGTVPRSVVAVNPKLAATWQTTSHVAFYGVVTHAFRAPTLNELFRNFRVGNAITTANALLDPETLTGGEGGISITGSRAALRVVGFYNHLSNAVTNVTLSSTPALIVRQRDNAGTIRAAGADIEGEWQIVPMLRANVGTELVDSILVDAIEPGLAGNRVPQVPRFHVFGGLQLTAPGGLIATAQVRAIGAQYDDDRNQFLLGPATIADAYVAKDLSRALQVYAAVENLADTVYDVGRTPTRTVGLPRTARVGLRIRIR